MSKGKRGRQSAQMVERWFRRPIVEFFETEASGGIVLLIATAIAFIWANTPWHDSYDNLWHTYVGISWGEWDLKLSLHHWINDGLMALFFFLVGLEIKREILSGELSSMRKAALPAMAAVGGMAIPALLYFAMNPSGEAARGWGIPMATDIAFAIGVLMLLGKRIPLGLKVFLTALAVVDDLGAVLVIALFYTAELAWVPLVVGLGLVGVLFGLGALGVRQRTPYLLAGIVVWFCFLKSGVHATLAGVLVALTIPHQLSGNRAELLKKMDDITDDLLDRQGTRVLSKEHLVVAMEMLQDLALKASSMLQDLEHKLAPKVAYVVMPIFALANAGITIDPEVLIDAVTTPVPLGILLGLIVGKQIGVFGLSWLAVKVGWADLPRGVTWRGVYGASILAGIGFTMSLFIANLAFTDPEILKQAKLGILIASGLAAIVGSLILYRAPVVSEEDLATEALPESKA